MDFTADDMSIQSDDFSVDKKGKIKATAGEIGGFNLTTDKLNSELYSKYAYSQTDLDKIRDSIMGTIELTAEEVELYDVDGDGEITAVDYMMIGNYVSTGTSQENPGEVAWSNGDVFKTFTIKDGTGETIINLNAFRNYIKILFGDIITVDRINAGNIQFGKVDITPTANEPTIVSVEFDNVFNTEPVVLTGAWSGVPGTAIKGTSATNITEYGFDAVVTRSNTQTTSVMWIAIG